MISDTVIKHRPAGNPIAKSLRLLGKRIKPSKKKIIPRKQKHKVTKCENI